jgi:hypothetical protein
MTPAGFDYSGVDVIYACVAVLIYYLSIKCLESWEKGSPGSSKPTGRLQMGGFIIRDSRAQGKTGGGFSLRIC